MKMFRNFINFIVLDHDENKGIGACVGTFTSRSKFKVTFPKAVEIVKKLSRIKDGDNRRQIIIVQLESK